MGIGRNRIRILFDSCLLLMISLGPVACTSIGPTTVRQDQFDYNEAIADSDRQQLLLNLVRLRYSESPTFLKVSSVIASYSRVTSVNARVGANTAFDGDNTASVGGEASWVDNPTITYVPISGQEFSRNLLTPLPPSALLKLTQSGWPGELVIRLSTSSINDLHNDVARLSRRRQADPGFFEVFKIFKRLRQEGVIGLRLKPGKGGQDIPVLFLRRDLSAQSEQNIVRFRELLNLDPDATEFRIIYGVIPEESGDIAMLSGSIWDIMLNLAWQFNVPPEHIENGYTGTTFESSYTGGAPPIEVSFSKVKPNQAFVSAFTHDYWFFIPQHDRLSKRAFSFLQLLLTTAVTSVPDRSPVVTISR